MTKSDLFTALAVRTSLTAAQADRFDPWPAYHAGVTLLSLLPLQRRVRTVLDALVNEANAARGEALHTLTDKRDQYVLTFNDCLYCANMHPAEAICYTVVGTLEAVLKWGTGRDFTVREVKCAARGDAACVFEIDKQPLHV